MDLTPISLKSRPHRHRRAGRRTITHDSNGNRLTSVQTTGSGTTSQVTTRAYNLASASNRLSGFTQTIQSSTGQSSTTVNHVLNANGDLLDDGLRRYRYDPDGRLAAVTTGSTLENLSFWRWSQFATTSAFSCGVI